MNGTKGMKMPVEYWQSMLALKGDVFERDVSKHSHPLFEQFSYSLYPGSVASQNASHQNSRHHQVPIPAGGRLIAGSSARRVHRFAFISTPLEPHVAGVYIGLQHLSRLHLTRRRPRISRCWRHQQQLHHGHRGRCGGSRYLCT